MKKSILVISLFVVLVLVGASFVGGTTTTNYGLWVPSYGDGTAYGDGFQRNWSLIDTAIATKLNSVGTVTADSATVGSLGEYSAATITAGQPVSMATNSIVNVASLTLTAGDWDVTGVIDYPCAGVTATNFQSGISATSLTFGGQDTFSQTMISFTTLTSTMAHPLPVARVSLSTSTTYYLIGRALYSAGTMSAYGTIRARRIR